MPSDLVAQDLTITVRRNDEVGIYEYGVFQSGAWVTLFQRKTGGVDDDIQRAADEAARSKEASDSPPPPPSQ